MASKIKAHAGACAEAERQQSAIAAGAWRLAELTSLEERVSVLLAMQAQLRKDRARKAEHERLINVMWDVFAPELSASDLSRRELVAGAVRHAATPRIVREAMASLEKK